MLESNQRSFASTVVTREGPAMSRPASPPQPPSPLDGFLRRFLVAATEEEDGFSPTLDTVRVATELDCPPAFVEALFTSARTRGLVEPAWTRGPRGRNRWRLSARGEQWQRDHEDAPRFGISAPG